MTPLHTNSERNLRSGFKNHSAPSHFRMIEVKENQERVSHVLRIHVKGKKFRRVNHLHPRKKGNIIYSLLELRAKGRIILKIHFLYSIMMHKPHKALNTTTR
eukprot:TRINITY_DN20839_c0_g1_i4.p1 TRINITY_DN20839_c0_g1~~TRINITY_DN20839_c0_g1_i4.p1  ORF type:complete len:102 (+),score=2.51 TRINITY_DN20839_c0_g1_i4:347-652(+)